MQNEQLEQVTNLFDTGKMTEAQDLLWKILESDPHDDTAWIWYAYTFPSDDEKIQVLEECLRLNPDSQSAHDTLVGLRQNDLPVNQQSGLLESLNTLYTRLAPYFQRFGNWYNTQEGVVKAAVVSAIGIFSTAFITGCFALTSALLTRPDSPSATIVTATPLPTPTALVTPTPNSHPTPKSTPSPQSKTSQPIIIPPKPILDWLSEQNKAMSFQMKRATFGVAGGILFVLGLWQLGLIFLNKTEKNKDTIFSSILTAIVILVAWQFLGWVAVVIGVVGSFGILVLICGITFSAILHIPYLGGSLVGTLVATFIGIGCCFIYFAISGTYNEETILLAFMVGASSGAVLGLILSSFYHGRWYSPVDKT